MKTLPWNRNIIAGYDRAASRHADAYSSVPTTNRAWLSATVCRVLWISSKPEIPSFSLDQDTFPEDFIFDFEIVGCFALGLPSNASLAIRQP